MIVVVEVVDVEAERPMLKMCRHDVVVRVVDMVVYNVDYAV